MSVDSEKQKPKGSWVWLIVGCVLTVAALGGWVYLLSSSETCAPIGILECLQALDPNELGDTLTGAFSPIAFLWLVLAVVLQRNELQAQREELIAARSVAKEQVNEAKNNVSVLNAQTKILEAQLNSAQARDADEDIEEVVPLVIQTYIKKVKKSLVVTSTDASTNSSRELQLETLVGGENELGTLSNAALNMQWFLVALKKNLKDGRQLTARGAEEIIDLERQFIVIEDMFARASPPMKMRLEATNVLKGAETTRELIALIEASNRSAAA